MSLRIVERAVEPWRRELPNAALATLRFETPPGRQLQADFGQCLVSIGGERVRVHLAALTLGYSRRLLVRAFRSEKQDHWLQTLEEGFRHWGGVPQEVQVDNAAATAERVGPRPDLRLQSLGLQAIKGLDALEVFALAAVAPQAAPADAPLAGEADA